MKGAMKRMVVLWCRTLFEAIKSMEDNCEEVCRLSEEVSKNELEAGLGQARQCRRRVEELPGNSRQKRKIAENGHDEKLRWTSNRRKSDSSVATANYHHKSQRSTNRYGHS